MPSLYSFEGIMYAILLFIWFDVAGKVVGIRYLRVIKNRPQKWLVIFLAEFILPYLVALFTYDLIPTWKFCTLLVIAVIYLGFARFSVAPLHLYSLSNQSKLNLPFMLIIAGGFFYFALLFIKWFMGSDEFLAANTLNMDVLIVGFSFSILTALYHSSFSTECRSKRSEFHVVFLVTQGLLGLLYIILRVQMVISINPNILDILFAIIVAILLVSAYSGLADVMQDHAMAGTLNEM